MSQATMRPTTADRSAISCPIVSLQPKAAVLLIEDESAGLAMLVEVLERAGYVCACCSSAEAAMSNAQSFAPDLIIAATNLAGVNGVTLCEGLQKLDGLTDTPVLYLSRTQVPDIIRRGHSCGASYHLRQPFDPEVLLELVGKALHANRFHPASDCN